MSYSYARRYEMYKKNGVFDPYNGVSNHNKEAIKKFEAEMEGEPYNNSPNTILNQRRMLIKYARYLDQKSFKQATKHDVQTFFNTNGLSTKSQELMKAILRKFYRWLYNLDKNDQLPDSVRWIKFKTMRQKNREIDIDAVKEKVITQDEYQRMMDNTYDLQEQAILEVLYWWGPRVSELKSMNVKHVEDLPEGVFLSFPDSKTKPRRIPQKDPYPSHVIDWYNKRKKSTQPDDSLWVNPYRRKDVHGKRLSKGAIERLIDRIAQDTGIGSKTRRITPHSFRHTAISRDRASGMPDTLIETKYGLVKGSVMLQVYDHTGEKELKEYITKKSENESLTYDGLKREKERAEKYADEIKKLKQKINDLKQPEKEIEKQIESRIKEFEKRMMANLKEMISKPGKITFDYKDLPTL